MRQEICKTIPDAIKIAKDWQKTEEYVVIIESKGEFFVENEASLVRNWERVVWSWEK